MKPDPTRYDPRPEHIRALVSRTGLTQTQCAQAIGITPRAMRFYLAAQSAKNHRKPPYILQFALECLAAS